MAFSDISEWTTESATRPFILDSDTFSELQVQDKSKLFMRHSHPNIVYTNNPFGVASGFPKEMKEVHDRNVNVH